MVFSLSTSTDSTQRTTSRYPSIPLPLFTRPAGRTPSAGTHCPTCPLITPVQLLPATRPRFCRNRHHPSSVLSSSIFPDRWYIPFLLVRGAAPEPGDPPTHRLGPRAVPPHPLYFPPGSMCLLPRMQSALSPLCTGNHRLDHLTSPHPTNPNHRPPTTSAAPYYSAGGDAAAVPGGNSAPR